MSTIADVAARAGVSKATASRALSGRGYVSEQTRLRVAEAARELSYVAHPTATSLATGRTRLVGAIVPTLDRWFFAQVVEGVQSALLAEGYDLALYTVPADAAERDRLVTEVLAARRCDGLIAAGIQPDTIDLAELADRGIPVVSAGPPSRGIPTVAIDDVEAARIATEHLLGLGHTDVAFLGEPDGGPHRSVGDARRVDGYRTAMDAAGLGDRIRAVSARPTMPGGYAAAAELLADRRMRPTGIVGVCDEVAIGAIIAARRLGIAVPAELSVVGIDDHRDAEMFTLTTIRQRPREQGEVAVRMLRELLERPDAPVDGVVAASVLVVRNSTAPAR